MTSSPDAVFEVAGVAIPRLGLGTFGLAGEVCADIVARAVALGFRHVDTAEMYGNEREVGEGLRRAGAPRGDVFVTTKVWHDHLTAEALPAAAEASLDRLGLSFVDLLLIHWPNAVVPLGETIEALNAVHAAGRCRAIGISNFPVALMEASAAASAAPLAVNQVEYHPFLSQTAVLAAARRLGMGVTAYSPLARGTVNDAPAIRRIAERRGVTPAAVALAWLLNQPGVLAIPKTGTAERLGENLAALDLVLDVDEMTAIGAGASPRGRMIDPAFAPAWDAA